MLNSQVREIGRRIVSAGGYPLLVGGCVRDQLLGIEPKDFDIEIYRLPVEEIIRAFDGFRIDVVGKAFGVIKVFFGEKDFDLSVPRRENKCGVGHKEFEILPDPSMTPHEAAARRDFTINSLAATFEGETIDFFDGLRDIRARVLRATSKQFSEDPLRVLRGMQFAARFGFSMEARTIRLCRDMLCEYDSLAKERIWGEFQKLFVKGRHVGRGLTLLRETEWLSRYPELHALDGCLQDPIWHPEGDTLQHTLHVCDAAQEIATRDGLSESERLVLLFGALLHDVGKASMTTRNSEGRWVAPGHAEAGVLPARMFLERIGAPNWLIDQVLPLVREHMAHVSANEPNERIVRRLAVRLAPTSFEMWSRIVEADHSGRPPLPKGNPAVRYVEIARELAVQSSMPQPLLLGRHLIAEFNLPPSPRFGDILRAAFEAQLDEGWTSLEHALAWARERLQS